MADDLRLAALLLIKDQGKLCVCELTEAFEVSQPKVSRHLASLREAGLLKTERRGQWVYYYLHPHLPDWVVRVLEETARNNTALIRSEEHTSELQSRPHLVCRLLLEKKKKKNNKNNH